MPKRPFCRGQHRWVSDPRKGPGYWKCGDCPAQVPCKGGCAHLDCNEEVRGKPPKCPVCRKPAEWGKALIVSKGEHGTRIHEECMKKGESNVPEQAAE